MTVSINSVTIPQSIRERGKYIHTRHLETKSNGAGAAVTAGTRRSEWTFKSLKASDYAWWVTTLLGGAPSLTAAAVLWDDLDVETSFSTVTVHYPTYDDRRNGRYWNVKIVIDTMVAA